MGRLSARLISCIILSVFSAGQALAAPLNDAQDAYASGNYAKAFELYTQLVKKGDDKVQLSLGVMYYIGQGVTQSYTNAAKLFERSAKQGNVLAQNILGEMYDEGLGVPQDYKTAAKWYRLAAEQGDPNGQYNLGLMYVRELGVPQDYIQGYMWMSLSGRFLEELEFVAKQMTPSQIGKAQELSDQCALRQFKKC